MGLRQLLTRLYNRPEGKTFEVWEEADGTIAQYLNGDPTVTAKYNPLTGGNRILGADALIAAPKTLIIVGDSRTQQNYDQSASKNSTNWRPVAIAMMLSGFRMKIIGNAGVNGEKVSDLLLRYQGANVGVGFGTLGNVSLPAASSPGVLGIQSDAVYFNMGFNDLFGASRSAVDTFADAKVFMDDVLKNGRVLFVASVIYPAVGASGYSVAKVVQTNAYNRMLRDYAAGRPRCYYIETCGASADKTSASVETAAADLRDAIIHENNRSGWRQGKVIAAAINEICPARQDLLPSINALTSALDSGIRHLRVNPLMTGTSAVTATGFSGNAPTGIGGGNFARSGSASAVLSVAARADGYGQDFALACTFTAAGESVEFRDTSYHSQVAAGRKYYAVCQIDFSGPSGAALTSADNLRAVQLSIQATVDGVNNFVYCGENTSTDGALFESGSITLLTPELTLPAGACTIFRTNVGVIGNGAGTPLVKISRLDLVEVE